MSHPLKRTRAGPPRRLRRTLAVTSLTVLGSLVGSTWVGASAATAAGDAAASPTAAVAAPAPAASAAVPASAAAAPRPVLRQGSKGNAVTVLQRRLQSLGYVTGSADGSFGSQTFHGVVAFQKVNNLPRDGVVGASTWARLDSPLVPKARYNHPGLAVEVNLTKQVLYLTQAGKVVKIVDASSGKASTPTPVGDFTDLRQIDGWRQSDLGLLWRPHYFHGGYAIHGSSSVPNYPASHGCVRVTIASMNYLWTILHTGMPVHVYRP